MTVGDDKQIQGRARVKIHYIVIAASSFLVSVLLSIAALVTYSASTILKPGSRNALINPMSVYSPLTLHRGDLSASSMPIGLPLFPEAVLSELCTFGWRQNDGSTDGQAALVIFRFQTNAPPSAVSAWYQQAFPRPFTELRKEQILSGPWRLPWFKKLDVTIGEEVVLYETNDPNGVRGAIVGSLNSTDRSAITIFHYSQGR